tara:strand:- start:491 stop:1804 length:1314 start_codon:yes stop_codon:yes gene_type:complete
MFDRLKYLLIEYIHLILPVAIIIGLFINNMPINFGFGKFTDEYMPREFTGDMSKSIGIDPGEYPQAYSLIASIYRVLKSIISPDYKTTLFKVIMIIFILSILFGFHYSMVFEECILIITVFSAIFWVIFGASMLLAIKINEEKAAQVKNWFEENFDNLQVDTSLWLLLNTFISLIVTVIIFLIFKIVLNVQESKHGGIGQIHSENSSKGSTRFLSFLRGPMNDPSSLSKKFNYFLDTIQDTLKGLKEHPEAITIILSILILTLYYRIDGIAYLGNDILDTINERRREWWKNLTKDPHPEDNYNYDRVYNIIWFIVYLSIFVYILTYHFNKKYINSKLPFMKHLSLFNMLADETHHPILVFGFYFYFFLCREKYTGGWFFVFVFATCIEYLKTSGKFKSLADKMAGKVASKMPPDIGGKFSDIAGQIASNMPSGMKKI